MVLRQYKLFLTILGLFFSSTESENIPNTSITHSRTTDDDKRLEKLKTVEDLLKELELTSERDGEWTCQPFYKHT
jgi:hypothetical protein